MEGFWSADDNYLSWYAHLVVLGIRFRLLVKEGHKLAKDREIPRRRRVDALGHFDEDLVEVRGAIRTIRCFYGRRGRSRIVPEVKYVP